MLKKYKKIIFIITGVIIIAGGVFWDISKTHQLQIKKAEENLADDQSEKKMYEVLVAVRNQKNSDSEEDRKNSMKKGYVMGVNEEGQKWSDTEKTSYLILKMNLTEKQKTALTQPIEKEISLKKLSKEEREMLKEEGREAKKEKIGLRIYKINLEKIGFNDPKQLVMGQPFEKEVFNWDVVEKVSITPEK